MEAPAWAALAAGIATVLGAFFTGIRLIIRELRPNGGASMKDQVDRLEARIDQIYTILLRD